MNDDEGPVYERVNLNTSAAEPNVRADEPLYELVHESAPPTSVFPRRNAENSCREQPTCGRPTLPKPPVAPCHML